MLQMLRSACIVLHSGSFAVLRTVQLNSKFCLVAEKVQDIVSDDLLSPETGTAVTKEIEPQMPFFLGHVFAKCTGISEQRMVSSVVHGMPPRTIRIFM